MPDALVLDVPVELGLGPACRSASCAPCAHGRPSVAGSSHCDTGCDKPRQPRCGSRDSVPATRRYAGPQGGVAAPVCCWPTRVQRRSDGHDAMGRNGLGQHPSTARSCLHLRITQRTQEHAACDESSVDRLSSNTPSSPQTKIIKGGALNCKPYRYRNSIKP